MNNTYNKKLKRCNLDLEPCFYVLRSVRENNKMSLYGSCIGGVLIEESVSLNRDNDVPVIGHLKTNYDRYFIFTFEI